MLHLIYRLVCVLKIAFMSLNGKTNVNIIKKPTPKNSYKQYQPEIYVSKKTGDFQRLYEW